MSISESGENNVFAITLYEGQSSEDTVLLYNLLVANSTFNGFYWETSLNGFEIAFVGTKTSYFDGAIVIATYVPELKHFRMETQNAARIANIYLDISGLVSLAIYG